MLEPGERTRDIYEKNPDYDEPPLIPLPEYGDLESLTEIGLKLNNLSRRITNVFLGVSGLGKFWKQLPDNLENILRKTNTRGPALFAPVISATLAFEDDRRNLLPLQRAATLLIAAHSLWRDIVSAGLKPDQYKDQPLEMGQYPNLFSTNIVVDRQGARLFKSTNISSITVITNGHFISLDLWNSATEVTADNISLALENIVKIAVKSQSSGENPSPGPLTAATDRTQFKAFQELWKNPSNTISLSRLQHSFLTLCLDLDQFPLSDIEAAVACHAKNYDNRWFHSSLQIVVFGNGKACLIGNFSTYIDGNVMMRSAHEIQLRATQIELQSQHQDTGQILAYEQLKWEFSPRLLDPASNDINKILDDQPSTFIIDQIGRDFFTSHKIEAVPAFLLALQLTAHRLTGKMPGITQFLAMSRYRCMDLITTSMTTPDVSRFVEYVRDEIPDIQQARSLMDQAIQSQINKARWARRYLPVTSIFYYHLHSRRGFSLWFTIIFTRLYFFLLRILKLLSPTPREILVSHPEIFPNIPIVGRPGVRLPYVKYFGLHYQIFGNRIVLTIMPGLNWQVPNSVFIEELKKNLEVIRIILDPS